MNKTLLSNVTFSQHHLFPGKEELLRKLRFICSKNSNPIFRMFFFLNSVISSGARNLLYVTQDFFTVGAVVKEATLGVPG